MNQQAKLAPFNWEDPLQFEGMLSDDERLIQDSAHRYCQEQLMPRILMANREETFDRSIFNEMGDLGLLAALLMVMGAQA